jgi:hypothetical protein
VWCGPQTRLLSALALLWLLLTYILLAQLVCSRMSFSCQPLVLGHTMQNITQARRCTVGHCTGHCCFAARLLLHLRPSSRSNTAKHCSSFTCCRPMETAVCNVCAVAAAATTAVETSVPLHTTVATAAAAGQLLAHSLRASDDPASRQRALLLPAPALLLSSAGRNFHCKLAISASCNLSSAAPVGECVHHALEEALLLMICCHQTSPNYSTLQ